MYIKNIQLSIVDSYLEDLNSLYPTNFNDVLESVPLDDIVNNAEFFECKAGVVQNYTINEQIKYSIMIRHSDLLY